MAKVDLELKKAFAELQQKAIETAQKLKLQDLQIENLKRNKQHAALTEREISNLDLNTKTYDSIGRMFMLAPLNQIKANLKKKQATAEEKIKTLENKQDEVKQELLTMKREEINVHEITKNFY